MIDRMFIQEEKVALSQDRVLAKEKPGNNQGSVQVKVAMKLLYNANVFGPVYNSCAIGSVTVSVYSDVAVFNHFISDFLQKNLWPIPVCWTAVQ